MSFKRHQFVPEVTLHMDTNASNSLLLPEVEATSDFYLKVRQFDVKLLKFSSNLLHLNLFEPDIPRDSSTLEEDDDDDEDEDGQPKIQLILMKLWKQLRNCLFNWINLILVLNIYSVGGILNAVYYHYRQDYYLLHLSRLQQAKGDNTSLSMFRHDANTSSQLEMYLRGQAAVQSAKLRELGSPLVSAPIYTAQCVYFAILAFLFILIKLVVLTSPGGKMRTHFVRILLEGPLAEQRRLNRLAIQEVNKYLDSNFIFIESRLEEMMNNNNYRKVKNSMVVYEEETIDNNLLYPLWRSAAEFSQVDFMNHQAHRALLVDYERNVDILRAMLIRGDLIKLYSFSAEWLNQTAMFHSSQYIFGHLFHGALYLVILVSIRQADDDHHHQHSDNAYNKPSSGLASHHSRPTSKVVSLVSLQSIVITFSFMCLGVAMALLLAINWRDEIKLLKRMKDILRDCVNVNERIVYGGLQDDDEHSNANKQWTLNSNLLFALISYKCFMLRTRQCLELHNLAANTCLQLIFVFPLLIRVHAPYCAPDDLLTLVYVIISNTWISTILMLASCNLNDQTIKLHKPLASLLAHIVQVNDGMHHHIYSQHSVWYLRQELVHLKQFQEPYLPQETPFTFRFSFAVLVRIQFWLNMITLSVFIRTTKKDPNAMTSSDYILNDPLGLLNDRFY